MTKSEQGLLRHTIRISTSQAGDLHDRVRRRWLQPTADALSGLPGAQVYAPRTSAQQALHLGALQFNDLELATDLHRLPSLELQAVINSSPAVRMRPDWEDLTAALLTPMTRAQEARWSDDLVRGARHLELAQPRPCTLTWLPEGTRIARHGQLWFASLAFQAPTGPRPTARPGGALGIDVGLVPLAVAAGARQTFQTRPIHLLTGAGLRALERRVADLPLRLRGQVQRDLAHIEFAVASCALETFTDTLLATATRVVAERLELSTFTSGFVPAGRLRAVIDWQQAWLPQRMYAAGVPFSRVPPAYTSQRCSRCGRLGQRAGARFICAQCGVADAHVNAARNVLRRGAGARRAGRP